MKNWKINSWRKYPVKHLPIYDDEKELDILCTLELNRWNGNENVELIIEDILKK